MSITASSPSDNKMTANEKELQQIWLLLAQSERNSWLRAARQTAKNHHSHRSHQLCIALEVGVYALATVALLLALAGAIAPEFSLAGRKLIVYCCYIIVACGALHELARIRTHGAI